MRSHNGNLAPSQCYDQEPVQSKGLIAGSQPTVVEITPCLKQKTLAKVEIMRSYLAPSD